MPKISEAEKEKKEKEERKVKEEKKALEVDNQATEENNNKSERVLASDRPKEETKKKVKAESPGKLERIVIRKKKLEEARDVEPATEISGYIDLAQRMNLEDFRPYFKGEKILKPKNGDLSYFNWKNPDKLSTCDSRNFKVLPVPHVGLLFRSKLDRKDIDVNPERVNNSFRKYFYSI